jgi:hypothetical protein
MPQPAQSTALMPAKAATAGQALRTSAPATGWSVGPTSVNVAAAVSESTNLSASTPRHAATAAAAPTGP